MFKNDQSDSKLKPVVCVRGPGEFPARRDRLDRPALRHGGHGALEVPNHGRGAAREAPAGVRAAVPRAPAISLRVQVIGPEISLRV